MLRKELLVSRNALLLLLALALGFGLFRFFDSSRARLNKETRFMMDTYVTISVWGSPDQASAAIRTAFDRMQEIAVKFSWLDPRSPLYDFNYKGTPVTDPEILSLIRIGLEVSARSQGAFDMTIEPLSELWGFYDKVPHLPTDAEIKDALKNVGYQHLSLSNGQLQKDMPGVRIDLGGIAKGVAIVEAVKALKAHGVASAMVDAGGDIYVIGARGGRDWNVGIKDPRADGLTGFVKVRDIAVIGSGDYERFFIKDGRRYHHIFDPKTGIPTTGVASVTLIYHDPVVAQAWAKIPFVLGPEKGLALLEEIPDLDAIIIMETGEKIYSQGLRHSLHSLEGSAVP